MASHRRLRATGEPVNHEPERERELRVLPGSFVLAKCVPVGPRRKAQREQGQKRGDQHDDETRRLTDSPQPPVRRHWTDG